MHKARSRGGDALVLAVKAAGLRPRRRDSLAVDVRNLAHGAGAIEEHRAGAYFAGTGRLDGREQDLIALRCLLVILFVAERDVADHPHLAGVAPPLHLGIRLADWAGNIRDVLGLALGQPVSMGGKVCLMVDPPDSVAITVPVELYRL